MFLKHLKSWMQFQRFFSGGPQSRFVSIFLKETTDFFIRGSFSVRIRLALVQLWVFFPDPIGRKKERKKERRGARGRGLC